MEHFFNHLRPDLVSPIQEEHTVVPKVVTKRSANVDVIELVIALFVGEGRDNAAIAVTDDV